MELIKPSFKIEEVNENTILQLIESAGRNCYKSEEKITDNSYEPFIKMLINKGHESVLEHGYIGVEVDNMNLREEIVLSIISHTKTIQTYDYELRKSFIESVGSKFVGNVRAWREEFQRNYFLAELFLLSFKEKYPILFDDILEYDIPAELSLRVSFLQYKDFPVELRPLTVRFICDRGVSHELVRHRLASFSQESTRYCNYGKKQHITFIIPCWLDLKEGHYTMLEDNGIFDTTNGVILFTQLKMEELIYLASIQETEIRYNELLRLKWTPQQARSVLPNSLKTEIVTTANYKEWKEIFKQRIPNTAHPQMRELMIPLLEECKTLDTYFL